VDSAETIRVVLVDDHALLREGMRRLLEQEPDLTVVGEAADGTEAVAVVKELMPDVVLMDVVMPGISGVEATKQIKQSCPQTAVLILSAYDDDRYILGLLEAGVAGYLLKSSRGREVVQAIRAARTGDAVLHPSVTARLLAHITHSPADAAGGGAEHLTERELEVLRLAAAGLGNKEIAHELELSLPTIKAHLVNVFNKMGVGSRTEAVLHALRRGWIHMEDVPAEPAHGAVPNQSGSPG
jgi:DNA-binding NarL/FixJ family response regulator